MSKVHQLKSIQQIPVRLEEAWDFFWHTANLFTLTPPALNLKFTNQLYGAEMYPGQVITYKVKPLLGIPLFWMTEITHVQKHAFFVDEQRKGPYALWHHQHHFKPIAGGIEMTDMVHYALPFGPLGNIAHSVLVKDQLHKIFTYRYTKIQELFGAWPGAQPMQLQIV
jgi:ligand-binding SRPBCC domain-containing protein